ncbi:MAG: hypothetical protein PHY14_05230 [Candidatus Gracilibacteria bacterium]|nr:hypothetical protein [Candidatus Gracilibacteria bacterium]
MASDNRFEEKILYKTHQHWIVAVSHSLKILLIGVLPLTLLTYVLVDYSMVYTLVGFFILAGILLGYEHYLWHHSWLLIGNQKITLSVRNKLFSQYAMNIRYRNIRDSAVSKNSFLGFFLKYGTLFVRSSTNEGDFQAHFVPKVGKVYALVNALSRYSDDERAEIDTIEKLHNYHTRKEFSGTIAQKSLLEENIEILKDIPGITEVIELDATTREYIQGHEEIRNHGVHEVLRRNRVLCFVHDSEFRSASADITAKTNSGEVYFPGVPFPEVHGKDVISASPGSQVHTYLRNYFPYATDTDATVLVGWNE